MVDKVAEIQELENEGVNELVKNLDAGKRQIRRLKSRRDKKLGELEVLKNDKNQ